MEVAAALDVRSYRQDQIDLGIKREHIAQLMTASRDAATRDVAAKMDAGATWEQRRRRLPGDAPTLPPAASRHEVTRGGGRPGRLLGPSRSLRLLVNLSNLSSSPPIVFVDIFSERC